MSTKTPGSGTQPPDGSGETGRGADLTPEERAAFQARADAIGKRLETAKGQSVTLPKAATGKQGGVDGSAMGKALRASTELIGGVVVGSGIGWLLDAAFKTGPLFFILFFLLGSAAGMLNVIRSSQPRPGEAPKATPSAPVKDDDEND